MPSVSFRETMSGSYWRLDSPIDERALTVRYEAHAAALGDFLRRRTWSLVGTIDAEQLASGRPIEGTLGFGRIEERRFPYRFAFHGDDGRRYELMGEKEWSHLAPLESLTLLPATLSDDRGEEIARAMLRFDLRADWAQWLRSIRVRLGD